MKREYCSNYNKIETSITIAEIQKTEPKCENIKLIEGNKSTPIQHMSSSCTENKIILKTFKPLKRFVLIDPLVSFKQNFSKQGFDCIDQSKFDWGLNGRPTRIWTLYLNELPNSHWIAKLYPTSHRGISQKKKIKLLACSLTKRADWWRQIM